MNNTNAREVAKVVAKTIYMDPIQDIAKMVRERIDMEIDAKQRQRCADADNSTTHLCDTCKYREEECKPRNARIVAGEVTECDGYEEDGTCSD